MELASFVKPQKVLMMNPFKDTLSMNKSLITQLSSKFALFWEISKRNVPIK